VTKGKSFVCSHCRYLLEASDQGHRYFLSDAGKPQFLGQSGGTEQREELIRQSAGRDLAGKAREAFLAQRMGRMSDLLCLDCGSTFKRDLDRQEAVCPRFKCKSKNVVATWRLAGKTCPSCKTGCFKEEGPRGAS
jgi:hypothetical protein